MNTEMEPHQLAPVPKAGQQEGNNDTGTPWQETMRDISVLREGIIDALGLENIRGRDELVEVDVIIATHHRDGGMGCPHVRIEFPLTRGWMDDTALEKFEDQL